MLATKQGNVDAVAKLLSLKRDGVYTVDVNAANVKGKTALMLAAEQGNVDVVRMLMA